MVQALPPLLADPDAAARWLRACVAEGGTLASDSRRIERGDAFLAWPGAANDARSHVAAALQAGAAAVLVQAEGLDGFAGAPWLADPRVAALPLLRRDAGAVAAAFFGHPSRALPVLAVTGTNGKTSCAWWMAQAMTALGRRCAVVGTLGIGEPPRIAAGDEPPHVGVARPADALPIVPTGLTTPDPVALQAALSGLRKAGFAACAIEASSIGIAEHRLAALHIHTALFTNFTRDHLDYHGSMDAYWAAKRALFAWPGLHAAVLNVDDPRGAALADELAGQVGGPQLWTVSRRRAARLQALGLRYAEDGLAFRLAEGDEHATVHTTLVGDHNVDNLLGVAGALRAQGLALPAVARALCAVTAVPGRLQRVAGREVDVVVDYAHTPDALEKALLALRPLAAARGGRLWCVFGCGGDRDASKRPLMGAVAAQGADHVVLTSDNPRREPPGQILAQILAGVSGHDEVDVFPDRREAIRDAVRRAAPGDLVLLAGKGHEDYQEVAGQRLPFSDLAEATAALRLRDGGLH